MQHTRDKYKYRRGERLVSGIVLLEKTERESGAAYMGAYAQFARPQLINHNNMCSSDISNSLSLSLAAAQCPHNRQNRRMNWLPEMR